MPVKFNIDQMDHPLVARANNKRLPERVPKSHECSSECFTAARIKQTSQISPYLVPTKFGIGTKGKQVLYRTLCGRNLNSPEKVYKFLQESNCGIHIRYFNFNPYVIPSRILSTRDTSIVEDDISDGKEDVPINVVNSIGLMRTPFVYYITDYEYTPELENRRKLVYDPCKGCTCTDNCQDRSKCECYQNTLNFAKLEPEGSYKKLKNGMIMSRVNTGIYECHDNCSCRVDLCDNRYTQSKLIYPLQLFAIGSNRWCVRTTVDIAKGSVVMNYVGAVYQVKEDYRSFLNIFMPKHPPPYQPFSKERKTVPHHLRIYPNLPTFRHPTHVLDWLKMRDLQRTSLRSGVTALYRERYRRKQKYYNTMIGDIPAYQKTLLARLKLPEKVPSYIAGVSGRPQPIMNVRIASTLAGNISEQIRATKRGSDNLRFQMTFIDQHDYLYPRFCLFATKNIVAGQELTISMEEVRHMKNYICIEKFNILKRNCIE